MAAASLMTVAFSELRFARSGKALADFLEAEIDNFLPRLLQQIVRSADHQLQILAFSRLAVRRSDRRRARLVEDPLRGGVEQVMNGSASLRGQTRNARR